MRVVLFLWTFIIVMLASSKMAYAAARNNVVFVVIDDKSTPTLGPMPIARRVYSDIIRAAARAQAKAVVLKFFFDTSRPGDVEFALAMTSIPVYLQARLNDETDGTLAIDPRLARPRLIDREALEPLVLRNIEGPIRMLSDAATGIGFVDLRVDGQFDRIESIGELKGGLTLTSLALITAELAMGKTSVVEHHRLLLGAASFALDRKGRVVCDYLRGPAPDTLSVIDVLQSESPNAALRNKVVVVGYSRSDGPSLKFGPLTMPVHEVFFRQVRCLLQ